MKDTNLRSFVKGVTWRITGTIDTIFLAFIITGHFGNAVKIGLMEVGTKIVLYYLHERGWNLFKWGRGANGPSHMRSLAKGITWRITGTMDTVALSFLITGHIADAATIGASELLTKIILYYCHERVWSLMKWGRVSSEPVPVKMNEVSAISADFHSKER